MKKVLLFLSLNILFASALKLDELHFIMQENINKSIALLQKAPKDKSGVANEMFKLFDPIFDYKLMAKLSLSKNYEKLSLNEQEEFNKLFEAELKQNFTNKLSLYTNEKIKVEKQEQKSDTRVFLHSFMFVDGENKSIIFKFYKAKNDEWLIYDVDILGISIIQTYRSQFTALFEKEGFAVLVEKLKQSDLN